MGKIKKRLVYGVRFRSMQFHDRNLATQNSAKTVALYTLIEILTHANIAFEEKTYYFK